MFPYRMRYSLRCCSIALLLVSVLCSTGLATISKVTAEGNASLEGTTREAAQNEALRDAMRNAVQHAIGAMVSSESLVENFVLVKDRILTRVEGYVRHYEVIAQSCSDSDCTVSIQAEVEEMALADDVAALANLLPMMNYPTVVVAFTQSSLGQNLQNVPLDVATVEQTVYRTLTDKGFQLAEASALEAESLRQANIQGGMNNQSTQAIEAAANIAQVMISGQAVLQDNGSSPYNERIHSYGAFLTGKAFETGTGRLLATASAEANVPHHSFAIGTQKAAQLAAEKLSEKLSAEIVKGWLNACYNAHDVMLVVENLPFGKTNALQSAIMDNVKGALRVNQKTFLRGRAELAVNWQNCNTLRLADMLEGLAIDDAKLQVLEVQGNSVRVAYQAP